MTTVPALPLQPTGDSPLAIAAQVRQVLRTRSPSRFGKLDVRVVNGRVAITGCVPNEEDHTVALYTVQSAFQGTRLIDELAVRNRQAFRPKPLWA